MPNILSKTVASLVLSIGLGAVPGVAQVASEATTAPRSADFIAKGKYMVGLAPTVGFGSRVGVIAGGRLYGGYFWHNRNLVGVALRNYTHIKNGPVSLSQSAGVFNRFYINRHRFAFYVESGLYMGYYHQWEQADAQRPARTDVFPYASAAVGTTIRLSRRASLDFRVGDVPLLVLGSATWDGTPLFVGVNIHLP